MTLKLSWQDFFNFSHIKNIPKVDHTANNYSKIAGDLQYFLPAGPLFMLYKPVDVNYCMTTPAAIAVNHVGTVIYSTSYYEVL